MIRPGGIPAETLQTTVNIVNYSIITESSREELADRLASDILDLILEEPEKPFNIALSGGSTPGILFKFLTQRSSGLDVSLWENVSFYWVDERCVPPAHDESNYRMANKMLIKNIPVKPEKVHRMRGEDDPVQEAFRYSGLLRKKLPGQGGLPVFDLILLGMGGDGHTASIFPDQMDLLSSEKICSVGYHPETGQARITLTGPVINNASRVIFLVSGKDKAKVLKAILGSGPPDSAYPASHIIPTKGSLTWYLDRSAAAML
jgi:6-phosphogluconolactonase